MAESHYLRIVKSGRNDRGWSAGNRDLRNLKTTGGAFVEVNSGSVGYYLAPAGLRLAVVRELGDCFHDGTAGGCLHHKQELRRLRYRQPPL